MYQALRKGALKNVKIYFDRQKSLKVFKLFLIVLLYVIALYHGGYIASSLICICLSIYLFGGTLKQALIYSVVITLSLYLVFQIGFRIPLPAGELFEYWG
jgi:hypothetical protein